MNKLIRIALVTGASIALYAGCAHKPPVAQNPTPTATSTGNDSVAYTPDSANAATMPSVSDTNDAYRNSAPIASNADLGASSSGVSR